MAESKTVRVKMLEPCRVEVETDVTEHRDKGDVVEVARHIGNHLVMLGRGEITTAEVGFAKKDKKADSK